MLSVPALCTFTQRVLTSALPSGLARSDHQCQYWIMMPVLALIDVAGAEPMPDMTASYVGSGGNARTLFSTLLMPQ